MNSFFTLTSTRVAKGQRKDRERADESTNDPVGQTDLRTLGIIDVLFLSLWSKTIYGHCHPYFK